MVCDPGGVPSGELGATLKAIIIVEKLDYKSPFQKLVRVLKRGEEPFVVDKKFVSNVRYCLRGRACRVLSIHSASAVLVSLQGEAPNDAEES